MRVGITILPEARWTDMAPKWQAAERYGFDHAWTYDHLVWGGLPDSPWFGTTPTLTAAAMVTSTIRLGTFVTSPNFRHPVAFARDVLALDDISGGRFICGIGRGGDLDSGLLGEAPTVAERTGRFTEFTRLLDRVLTQDHVMYDGKFFSRCTTRATRRDVCNSHGCRSSWRRMRRRGCGWRQSSDRAGSPTAIRLAVKRIGGRGCASRASE